MWSGGRSTRKLLPPHVLVRYCAQYDNLHNDSVRKAHTWCVQGRQQADLLDAMAAVRFLWGDICPIRQSGVAIHTGGQHLGMRAAK